MLKIRLIPIIFPFFLLSCNKDLKETTLENPEVEKNNIDTSGYEIVNVEDQSRKAMGKKLLSQYEKSELELLPINKKNLYKIVLLNNIGENQIKPTVEKIIKNLTSQDTDIDEIILWLYSDPELTNSTYDIGTVIWAPFGKLGNIDAEIAQNNNRENYNINYQLRNNLDKYLSSKLEDIKKHGLTTDERKQVFKDKVKAEDDAFEKKQSEQKNTMKKNYSKILKKYNINFNQLNDISTEGQDKNWPLD